MPGDDPRRGDAFRHLLALPEKDRGFFFDREIFGRLNTLGVLDASRRLVTDFSPDVVVSDAAECAGGLAAEEAGVPWVRVHPGLSGDAVSPGLVAGVTDLRSAINLDPDTEGRWLQRALGSPICRRPSMVRTHRSFGYATRATALAGNTPWMTSCSSRSKPKRRPCRSSLT